MKGANRVHMTWLAHLTGETTHAPQPTRFISTKMNSGTSSEIRAAFNEIHKDVAS